ncbi:thiamine ABC transporter substrate binding subunit [Pseudoroseicyclus sp. CXY001]|uniref:thiamine ABC transporter substrate binding subunit n=1 Tax=Pseudoroseicyclus sp. CXY001 TaxID=3242492 RepID=UPI0035716F77
MRVALASGLSLAASAALAQTPELTIYTYDSFVTDYGPGPVIAAAFEEKCGCTVSFEAFGEGAALLSRIRLEGARSEADIVLGLDTNLIAAAAETGLFAPHGVTPELDMPVAWDDPLFLPYDWGWFAFVGNVGDDFPTSFRELAESDLQVVIEDPRSSTPGLGLVYWVEAAYGDEAPEIWAALADNILTVTPGWSEAYGLFTEGEADAALSYTTSPAYHIVAEGDETKAAMAFEEGHYMQVEVAGKLAATDVPELADAFLAFMLTEGFQSVIPETNWMYPVTMPEGGLGAGWDGLVTPETSLLYSPEEAAARRDAAIEAWRTALAR